MCEIRKRAARGGETILSRFSSEEKEEVVL